MTTPADLIARLNLAGVTLTLDKGRLRFKAPQGAYTDELRELVAKHRGELVEYLAWDAVQAERTLADVARLTRGAGDGTGRIRVLTVFLALANRWSKAHDSRLYEVVPCVKELLERWRDGVCQITPRTEDDR